MHPHKLCVSTFNYNPDTGEFTRRDGYPVLTCFDTDYFEGSGRLCIEYFDMHVALSRVIWYWVTGKFPERGLVIDHVDRDPSNNRWKNLRKCTSSDNLQNTDRSPMNGKKFLAHVNRGTESIDIGWCDTKEERDRVVELAYKDPTIFRKITLDDLVNFNL